MRKSLKVLSVTLGIAILVGVLGVGAVLAADPTPTPTTTTTKTDYQQLFLSKLAQILGIDEQRLTDAMTQARKDTENQMIDDAVKAGRMSQEYADWLKQRPSTDGKDFGFGFGLRGFGFGGRGHGFFGGHGKSVPATATTQ